jgi:hypothetical protein
LPSPMSIHPPLSRFVPCANTEPNRMATRRNLLGVRPRSSLVSMDLRARFAHFVGRLGKLGGLEPRSRSSSRGKRRSASDLPRRHLTSSSLRPGAGPWAMRPRRSAVLQVSQCRSLSIAVGQLRCSLRPRTAPTCSLSDRPGTARSPT